jgi:hypothetical protein
MNKKPNLNMWFSTVFKEHMIKQHVYPDMYSYGAIDYGSNMPEHYPTDFPETNFFRQKLKNVKPGIYSCDFYVEEPTADIYPDGIAHIFLYKSGRIKTILHWLDKNLRGDNIYREYLYIESYLEKFKGECLPPRIYQKCLMVLL